MKILGAGISGLIAASVFPQAEVYESSPKHSPTGHKALLRFRSKAVAEAVGIDFRKVAVHKGLWSEGRYVQPSILHANRYSQKVVGRLADRSVWSLDKVERFIAPEDFVDQLVQRAGSRIHWATPAEFEAGAQPAPVVSTIPMNVMAGMMRAESPSFGHAQITVQRWRIPGADVFQSVYVSDPATTCYRVSITGDLLIAEWIGDLADGFNVLAPFGLTSADAEKLDTTSQRYGKISPIDERWRKNFILRLSNEKNIYSLGRFGTWRNILLDDVVHDLSVIKRLINDDAYGRSRHNAK